MIDDWQRPTTPPQQPMTTFWAATAERALKTVAQTLLALWGGTQFNLLTVDWKTALGISTGAGALSILTSLASLPIGPTQSPSLIHEKTRA